MLTNGALLQSVIVVFKLTQNRITKIKSHMINQAVQASIMRSEELQ